MAEHTHTEFVSKSQVLLWMAGAGMSLVLLSWTLHTQNVSREVYEQTLENQAEWRDEQRRELGELKATVDGIMRIVLARSREK